MAKSSNTPSSGGNNPKPVQKPIKPQTGNVGTRGDSGGKVTL